MQVVLELLHLFFVLFTFSIAYAFAEAAYAVGHLGLVHHLCVVGARKSIWHTRVFVLALLDVLYEVLQALALFALVVAEIFEE